MRRSAAAAILALALLATTASAAGARGEGSALVKVKAPAVGKGSVQLVTIKVTGPKPGPPKLKVTNLAALGKGFGGATVVKGPKKPSGHSATYKAYLILYLGNAGKATTGTIDLQVTPPSGDAAKASAPKDETHNCPLIKGLTKADEHAASSAYMFDNSGSVFTGFFGSMVGFLCP